MTPKLLREYIRKVILDEVKTKFVRAQAAKGALTDNAKTFSQRLAAQLEKASTSREDSTWVKNTKIAIEGLSKVVANQALMLAWNAQLTNVGDEDDAPEMSDMDTQFGENVRTHLIGILTGLMKKAMMGEQASSSDEIDSVCERVIANVQKSFKVGQGQKLSKPTVNAVTTAAQ